MRTLPGRLQVCLDNGLSHIYCTSHKTPNTYFVSSSSYLFWLLVLVKLLISWSELSWAELSFCLFLAERLFFFDADNWFFFLRPFCFFVVVFLIIPYRNDSWAAQVKFVYVWALYGSPCTGTVICTVQVVQVLSWRLRSLCDWAHLILRLTARTYNSTGF